MRTNKLYFLLSCLFLMSVSVFAKDMTNGWYLTSFLGGSISAPSHLSINRVGEPDIETSAHWRGHPFEDSLYYAVRAEKWTNNRGRGFEWVHHKAYYSGNRSEVVDFSVSDGFNLFYYNFYARPTFANTISRFGAGLVFGNPDVTLNGRERFYNQGGFNGTYLSGVTVQYALEKWVCESPRNFLSLETKLTASWARIPISSDSNEYADVPNYAIHFLLGIGSKPMQSKSRKDVLWFFAPPLLYNSVAHLMPTGKPGLGQ